jgi:hypothetical protein
MFLLFSGKLNNEGWGQGCLKKRKGGGFHARFHMETVSRDRGYPNLPSLQGVGKGAGKGSGKEKRKTFKQA